jgi:hypothetical protein
MDKEYTYSKCPGCGTNYLYKEYPADNRYGIMSQECRAAFDELLAKESMNFGYPPAHRLVVDAYFAQHPPHVEIQKKLGIEKRFIDASVQSVVIHLIALYLAIEKKVELSSIAKHMAHVLDNINKNSTPFFLLEPPTALGKVMIQNLICTTNIETYTQIAWQWANNVWDAWSIHHSYIKNLYENNK